MPVSHRRAPRGRPRRNSVHKRPNSARRGPHSPFVYTIAATRGSPQPNSVHKRPNPTRRGPILPSVYTIAATRGSPQPNSVHKRPNPTRRGSCHPFVYTIAISRPPTTQAYSLTVYINAPIRRLEALTTHLCTLLRSLAPQKSRQVSWSNMSSSPRIWLSSRRRARW